MSHDINWRWRPTGPKKNAQHCHKKHTSYNLGGDFYWIALCSAQFIITFGLFWAIHLFIEVTMSRNFPQLYMWRTTCWIGILFNTRKMCVSCTNNFPFQLIAQLFPIHGSLFQYTLALNWSLVQTPGQKNIYIYNRKRV